MTQTGLPQSLPLETRQKITRQANRNLLSEVRLIMSAGFCLLMLLTFLAGRITFLPLAMHLGMRPTVVWVLMSFALAGLASVVHVLRSGPKIRLARAQKAAIERLDDLEKRAALVAKMKQRQ